VFVTFLSVNAGLSSKNGVWNRDDGVWRGFPAGIAISRPKSYTVVDLKLLYAARNELRFVRSAERPVASVKGVPPCPSLARSSDGAGGSGSSTQPQTAEQSAERPVASVKGVPPCPSLARSSDGGSGSSTQPQTDLVESAFTTHIRQILAAKSTSAVDIGSSGAIPKDSYVPGNTIMLPGGMRTVLPAGFRLASD
jgi:hypothetical protein